MAEQSNISWTDATLLAWVWEAPKLRHVSAPVTHHAQRYAVPNVKPQLWPIRKVPNVVGVQIATSVVAAMTAGKSIAGKNIVTPPLKLRAEPHASTLYPFAVNISWRDGSSRRVLARRSADFRPRFKRVLLSDPVARPRHCRRAHFSAAFSGHFRSFSHNSKPTGASHG